MVRGWYARCLCVGILCFCIGVCGVDGLIEIVEEQQCHDYTFRLTCRDMDSHIAILEAWYTSTQDYHTQTNQTVEIPIKTANDSELNHVYAYSSPKHNGVYEPTNNSIIEIDNVTSVNNSWTFSNDSEFWNDTEVSVESVGEGCGAIPFTRNYASWKHEGDKRRRPVSRDRAVNLRAPLSYRCMGVNHCSFILAKDYASSVSWSPGVVYIKYACFDDFLSIHYCNLDVDVAASGPDSEGYIRTPGYPHFYIEGECRWRIQAGPEQRVRVTLIDVSLRDIGPFEHDCKDYINVVDGNGDSLLTSCDQVALPLRLTSTTEAVDLVFRAGSKRAYPARGLLLHYKSVGCVTLPEPSDGYLVYRNEDVAHYMCNVNYVFVDTRQRARLIWCFDDNRWNDTVPLCVDETATSAVGNNSGPGTRENAKLPHNEANVMVDIVIPSLLIAALFIGNAFIVLIIYKYRKRKNEDLDEDEFNTIPLNVNGNIHSAGNAV